MAKSTVKVTMTNKGSASVSVRSKAFSGIIPTGKTKGVEVKADALQDFRGLMRKRYPGIALEVEGEEADEESQPAETVASRPVAVRAADLRADETGGETKLDEAAGTANDATADETSDAPETPDDGDDSEDDEDGGNPGGGRKRSRRKKG